MAISFGHDYRFQTETEKTFYAGWNQNIPIDRLTEKPHFPQYFSVFVVLLLRYEAIHSLVKCLNSARAYGNGSIVSSDISI